MGVGGGDGSEFSKMCVPIDYLLKANGEKLLEEILQCSIL